MPASWTWATRTPALATGPRSSSGAPHPDAGAYATRLSGRYTHRGVTGGIGHDLPKEAPQAFAAAVAEDDTHAVR